MFEMLHNEYDGVSDAASGADSHVRGGPTRGEQGQEPIREHHCMYDDASHWLASVTSVWVTLLLVVERFFSSSFFIQRYSPLSSRLTALLSYVTLNERLALFTARFEYSHPSGVAAALFDSYMAGATRSCCRPCTSTHWNW